MKVLLVYPRYPDTFWSFKHALKFISKKASLPPLGLLTVAAMLPTEWEKRLTDLNVSNLKDDDIKWADLVFISAMSIQKTSVESIIQQCKALGSKIVAGGPLFTTDYEEFLDVNHIICNEAEITLPIFLNDLKNGITKHVYTTNGWADIESTPIPLWQLINFKHYAAMNLQYSRGCPYDCDFCDITVLYGRKARTKKKEQVISELENLYQLGWRGSLFFVDDNFIGNKPKVKKEILPVIIEWMKKRNYPFRFFTEASINLADDEELMYLMVRAGFDTVFIGIESPNEESLVECGKVINKNRNMIASVQKIQMSGLQVQGGFIVGFDNDPASIFDKLSAFIKESSITTAMVGLLNAPKGTKLYNRLYREGRLVQSFSGDNTNFSMNFKSKMNYDTLIEGYKSILQHIYSPKQYYGRVKEFLKNYQAPHISKFDFKFNRIMALYKSMLLLGVIGKERYQYWKLFVWT
ncbi:MAG: DUF4070 domain-containing protein, partial [Ignavibacteriales bacterium]|nr:DUF4070 domain-containing protein [Ignavibacteriales bacterium]